MNFSDRLLTLRKMNGYSQRYVAQKLGITQATLSYWEHGKSEPSVKDFIAICDLYCVSADELLYGRLAKLSYE